MPPTMDQGGAGQLTAKVHLSDSYIVYIYIYLMYIPKRSLLWTTTHQTYYLVQSKKGSNIPAQTSFSVETIFRRSSTKATRQSRLVSIFVLLRCFWSPYAVLVSCFVVNGAASFRNVRRDRTNTVSTSFQGPGHSDQHLAFPISK